MRLMRFDYVDDNGDLHLSKAINDVSSEIQYGCGIYTFEKVKASWVSGMTVKRSKMVTFESSYKNAYKKPIHVGH